ncbi:MAG: hypothetical protein PHV37_06990 [Candidatus Gastranaerophilales bacterium]|nr:hypothetical protein [Candidatus Gastranaerophilales bacterium]
MSNFIFLKKNNENLYNVIAEAEKLFRDEYFDQTIIQTRKFAENICRDLLRGKVAEEDTFDDLINKLKDNSYGNVRINEFTDDLYYLKKRGNASAHATSSKNDGKIALECIERAYEISVFYSNMKYGYSKKLDNSVFSEEMLMTGQSTAEKTKPISLKKRYKEELEATRLYESKENISKPKKKNQAQKATSSRENSPINRGNKDEIKSLLFRIIAIGLLLYISGAYLYSIIQKVLSFFNKF